MIKGFITTTVQFKDILDARFLWNNATRAMSWILTSNTLITITPMGHFHVLLMMRMKLRMMLESF